jgi:predicted phage baseplate assembly protein
LRNRPGLETIDYRVGVHASFFERMSSAIAGTKFDNGDPNPDHWPRPLAALATRDLGDPTMALIDAWAVTGDVLSFYQDRIANEGFLRTAKERLSVLELAREIGYELNPGSAATAYLSFFVDDAPTSSGVALVPRGSQIKSMPQNGLMPETFEVAADTEMRIEWNTLRPQITTPQPLGADTRIVYLSGNLTEIVPGRLLLLVTKNDADELATTIAKVTRSVYDDVRKVTTVELGDPPPPSPVPPRFLIPFVAPFLLQQNLTATAIRPLQTKPFRDRDLGAMMHIAGWSPVSYAAFAPHYRLEQFSYPVLHINLTPAPTLGPLVIPDAVVGVFAFGQQLGTFGNGAPRYDTLPTEQTDTGGAYAGMDWDTSEDGRKITRRTDDSVFQAMAGNPTFFLERQLPGIVAGQWVLLDSAADGVKAFRIGATQDRSLAEFALTGKATGLRVVDDAGDEPTDLPYGMRNTTVHALSYSLPLAPLEVTADLGDGTDEALDLTLEDMVLDLPLGRTILLSGDRADLPGVRADEAAILKEATQFEGRTTITFENPLQYRYVRRSLTMSANVALATHGQSLSGDILGRGDSSQPNQTFALAKSPLTYVPAPTETGAASSLEVRVNGLLWHEVDYLYGHGPKERVYSVRIGDDSKVLLTFGDGVDGARVPTGNNNVVASYRTGVGTPGRIGANLLSILATRPPNIRSVTNPMPTDGGVDPESLEDARANAPKTVLTFGRIISRRDLEDFARTFAGIGKAAAQQVQRGERKWLLLSVGGVQGTPLDPTDTTAIQLSAAIDAVREPGILVRVISYRSQLFVLTASLTIHPDYIQATVLDDARARLISAFSFESRRFGQPATLAEAVTVLQSTNGVIAVDVDRFRLFDDPAVELVSIIPARQPEWTGADPDVGELVTIHPLDIVLEAAL